MNEIAPDPHHPARWPARPAWGAMFAVAQSGAGFGVGELVRLGQGVKDISRNCRGRLVYLATPYSLRAVNYHGDWSAMQGDEAEADAALWVGNLAVAGVTAISPIVLSHRACLHVSDRVDPLDGAFWHGWCRPLMHRCDALVIPEIAGWDASAGIWAEFGWFVGANRPVFVMGDGREWAR